jgi:DNA (cytosine-5)-methyltransferase 1
VRPPGLRLHDDELVVDSFAGGGGASLGIEMALGRSPDIAVNHDPEALAMHEVNHPGTRHFCESVWDVDPKKVCKGRKVALAWFSPDCTFHSKARGAKPFRDRNTARRRRGLAWVVIRWATAVKPRVICLENVEEFADWGPLLPDGKPCPARRGLTFRRWIARLRNCGYEVEYRELRACDYGAPTTRKRLFLIARSDGLPIVWPEPTHGPGRIPYRTAAECMDWSIPCRSIFGRKKPLAENTLKRIARGLRRYVIEAREPFIVPVAGETAAPALIQSGWGERKGQTPRALDLHRPLGTLMAGGVKHALVAAFLAKHYGGKEGRNAVGMQEQLGTITTIDHHALVASHLLKLRGGLADHVNTAQDNRAPAPTLTAGGTHLAEVRAFLVQYYGTSHEAQLDIPLHTITTKDRFGLVMVHGTAYVIADIGMRMLVPRELFRAQGFPDSYQIAVRFKGKRLTGTAQVRMVGNSVSPPVAAAIVRAQFAARAAMEAA